MRKAVLWAVVMAWTAAPLLAQEVRIGGKAGVRLQVKPQVAQEPDDETTRKIKQLLATKKVSFDFVETPFEDAVSFIRALLGVNMVIDPKVNTKQPLTLTVKDMSVGTALQWLLRLGGAKMEIRDGAIYVAPDPQKRGVTAKRAAVYQQAYPHRRMIGKAQLKVGDVATVELYLYEDDLPTETRDMLLKLLKTALKAELAKMAAGADAPKK